MKKQEEIITKNNKTSLETLIMNIVTNADNEYASIKKKEDDSNKIVTMGMLIIVILVTISMFVLALKYAYTGAGIESVNSVLLVSGSGLTILILTMILSEMIEPSNKDKYKMKKLISVYNHEDIIALKHPKSHILLLLKYILQVNEYNTINLKTISDILLEYNIKHTVQEVDSCFVLTINFNNTTYIIKSDSLSSNKLTMPDNLILDVLEICNLDKSLINNSWDEIILYIEKKKNIEKERMDMNHINKLNNINI